MKIAIQGHSTRGKEVIQILESLGGKNTSNHDGKGNYAYYISSIDSRIYKTSLLFSEYKHYTLEEFEKEFPFKIGDKVKDISDNEIGTILRFINISAFIDSANELMYVVKFEKSGYSYIPAKELKLYEEMKEEERNITLTLGKAREWYKKGGELREIALQAYSKEELNKIDLPKSWEEFCKNYPIKDKEAHVDSMSSIVIQNGNTTWRASIRDRNICPSKKSAEAHLALIQLEQLRDCWWNGWKPEWNAGHKYAIKNVQGEITILGCSNVAAFLVFPTGEMAEEFLECFKDLIELAKTLI